MDQKCLSVGEDSSHRVRAGQYTIRASEERRHKQKQSFLACFVLIFLAFPSFFSCIMQQQFFQLASSFCFCSHWQQLTGANTRSTLKTLRQRLLTYAEKNIIRLFFSEEKTECGGVQWANYSNTAHPHTCESCELGRGTAFWHIHTHYTPTSLGHYLLEEFC